MMMAAASAGLKAGGALFGGYESYTLGKLQSNLYASNAKFYGTQADTALLDKDLALTGGAFHQTMIDRKVKGTIGAENASYAARNLDPASGSPLLVQMHSAAQGAIDKALAGAQALLTATGAESRAASLKMQAANSEYQAFGAEKKGANDLIGGVFGAASALLGSAGSFGNLSSASSGAGSSFGKSSFDVGNAWGG